MTEFKEGDWVQGVGFTSGVPYLGTYVEHDCWGAEIRTFSKDGKHVASPWTATVRDVEPARFTAASPEPPPEITVLRETEGDSQLPFLIREGEKWFWGFSAKESPPDREGLFPWAYAISIARSPLEVYTPKEAPTPEKERAEAYTIEDPSAWFMGVEEEYGTSRGGILTEAYELIHGDRNVTYGSPTENFERIANLLNVQFDHKLAEGEVFTPQDVALMMIQVKMGRVINQPKRDNFVDIAGYAACAWETREDT